MKKVFITIFSLFLYVSAFPAETFFPYPDIPASLTTLSERTNYLVEHFWERCNLKSAFSSQSKLAGAFRDYVAVMPYASADTVHASIDALIKAVKKDSKNLLVLGQIAEGALYGDSAEVLSDELYLPFAKAVADNKKIKSSDKARFAYHAKILENSQIGATMPDFTFVKPDGSKGKLSDISTEFTLLFVNDPDCWECTLARTKLAADYGTRIVTEAGTMTILSVLPDEPNDEWRSKAESFPTKWVVGAVADIDEIIDLRHPPVFYLLDKDRKVVQKNLTVDGIINAFAPLASKITPIAPSADDDSPNNAD